MREADWIVAEDGSRILVIDGERIVCAIDERHPKFVENARLIAAAPDLLAALSFMLARFGIREEKDFRFSERLAVTKARAAIRLAMGRVE